MHRNHGRRIGLALAIVASALLLPAGAEAASKKGFTLFLQPAPPATLEPGHFGDVSGSLTNRSHSQTLGSSNVVAPKGFTLRADEDPAPDLVFYNSAGNVVSAPADADIDIENETVELRGLDLQPGERVDFLVDAQPHADACGTFRWSTISKQANNFAGEGNNFTLLNNEKTNLLTKVSTGCGLEFVEDNQPARARVGQPITAEDFDPVGQPIKVRLLGEAVGSATTVKLKELRTGYRDEGTLGGTTEVMAVNGVAQFSAVTMDKPGRYQLEATTSTSDESVLVAHSDPFEVESKAVECKANEECSEQVDHSYTPDGEVSVFDSTGSNVTVVATKDPAPEVGFLTVSLFEASLDEDLAALAQCLGYSSPLITQPGHAKVDGPPRPTTVTLIFDAALVHGAGLQDHTQLEACFSAPTEDILSNYLFVSKTGYTPVDGDGNGEREHLAGLLPDCGAIIGDVLIEDGESPCVSQRFSVDVDGDDDAERYGYTAVLPDGPDPQWG